MTDLIMEALSGEGDFAPIFKFANPGDSITGIITEPPKLLPLMAFGTNEPKIGKDGKPATQVLLVVASEQCQDDNHDGRWRVYVDKPLMRDAAGKAVKAAGASTLELGGEITITFTGYRVLGSGQAKDFTAKYEPALDDGPIGSAELGETGDVWNGDTGNE